MTNRYVDKYRLIWTNKMVFDVTLDLNHRGPLYVALVHNYTIYRALLSKKYYEECTTSGSLLTCILFDEFTYH